MPAQRKVFRIEEMMPPQGEPHDSSASNAAPSSTDVIAELRALRAMMEQRMAASDPQPQIEAQSQEARKLKIELDVIGDAIKQTRSEIVSLHGQGFDSSRIVRVTKELEAVFDDATGATDRILKAAEDIDQSANALAALVKGGHEQGLAQDIQDRVTGIFEACNFHDLTGQRISKVVATLKLVEEHLARMVEIWSVIERFDVDTAQHAADNLDGLLNGPKLAGDGGHSTQDEIDKLFH